MAGLDNNVIFLLRGDEFSDSSSSKTTITSTMSSSQIVDENNQGVDIKAINFNNANYLKFNFDSTFLTRPFTIDWWEKDAPGMTNTTSCLFGNTVGASGTMSFALPTWTDYRMTIAMSSDNANWNIASSIQVGDNIFGEWVHRAITFNGEFYEIYQNGLLVHTIDTSLMCYTPLDEFQMGRWRTSTNGVLNKKIYNFRISNVVRWTNDFTPQVSPYTERKVSLDLVNESSTNDEVLKSLIKVVNQMAIDIYDK